jgi:Ser-tRNA(Ala) deacylase AlaX
MTRKLFWDDPYLSRLDTRIATVEGERVSLESTIFYALSGGQESDRGTIGGHAVIAAEKIDHDIVYTLDPGHGLVPGDRVHVTIDWTRRYRLMRLHFAAELVLEIVYRRLGHPEKIGAHIAEDKARIDFAWQGSVAPQLDDIRGEAMAIIKADQPIISAYADQAAERRYWKIAEFAEVPCGGTHLKRTGEVGAIALKRRNIGKGKERIEIALAD